MVRPLLDLVLQGFIQLIYLILLDAAHMELNLISMSYSTL